MWKVLCCCLSVLLASCTAHACSVRLKNDTSVDLIFNAGGTIAIVEPGGSSQLEAGTLEKIEFGAIEHIYAREELRRIRCKNDQRHFEVRARSDGVLEVRRGGKLLHVVKPIRRNDLT